MHSIGPSASNTVSLNLNIRNGKVAAKLEPRKRPASPSTTESIERLAKKPCIDKHALLTSLQSIVKFKIEDRTSSFSSERTPVISAPMLFEKIYNNDIRDLEYLKNDKDFQDLCLKLSCEKNGSKITHFIAHSIYNNSSHISLLEFFDFIPLKIWAKKNTSGQSISCISNHPEILKKEIQSLLCTLTAENTNEVFSCIGKNIIDMVQSGTLKGEQFDEIWALIKKNLSDENYNTLTSLFRCESPDIYLRAFDDLTDDDMQILHAAIILGDISLFESIKETIYEGIDIFKTLKDGHCHFKEDFIFCCFARTNNPLIFKNLKELNSLKYEELVKNHLTMDPIPFSSFLYQSVMQSKFENLKFFYNSLSEELKSLFKQQLLHECHDCEDEEVNMLLLVLYDIYNYKKKLDPSEGLSTLLAIQPNLFTLLHTKPKFFSEHFDESELQTFILDHCPNDYKELAHLAFTKRREILVAKNEYQSIRSKESLDWLTQKNLASLEKVAAFWIDKGFITCLENLDADSIKALSNASLAFKKMFFIQKETFLVFYNSYPNILLNNFEKIEQLLSYQPILFGNKLQAFLPNPSQNETDDTLKMYKALFSKLDKKAIDFRKKLLCLEPIASILFQSTLQNRNILFSILDDYSSSYTCVLDSFIQHRPEETLTLLQIPDNNGANCLAECKHPDFIHYLHQKYPEAFESLIQNTEGKESVVATYLKKLKGAATEQRASLVTMIHMIFKFLPHLKSEDFFKKKRKSGESLLSILASLETWPILVDKQERVLNFSTIIDLSWKDDNENTLFHLAALHDNRSFIEEHYEKLSTHQFTQNSSKLTPLVLAYEEKRPKVFQFLANKIGLNESDLFDRACCPISHEIMIEPFLAVTDQKSAHSFEKTEIERHLQGENKKCPKTGSPIQSTALNIALRNQILATIKHFQEMQQTKLKIEKLEEQNK